MSRSPGARPGHGMGGRAADPGCGRNATRATDRDLRQRGRLDVGRARWSARRVEARTAAGRRWRRALPDRRAPILRLSAESGWISGRCPASVRMGWLRALEPQRQPAGGSRPGMGRRTPSVRAVRRAGDVRLPIRRMPLPTHASSRNPIEKLWRRMRQEVTRVHRWATDLDQLRNRLDAVCASFATGSSKAFTVCRSRIAEYLFKDHKPYLRSGKPCGLDQPGAPRQREG
jgi:hypothetical protein